MHDDVAERLELLAGQAKQLVKDLEYYWDDEGVSQLQIFIDPDLFQYLEKLYHESHGFAVRCQELAQLAGRLRDQ